MGPKSWVVWNYHHIIAYFPQSQSKTKDGTNLGSNTLDRDCMDMVGLGPVSRAQGGVHDD